MRHTLAFSTAALSAVAASALLGTGWPALELPVVAAAVILLGVPHGALDVLHAARAHRLAGPSSWALFTLGYVAVAAAVVGIWMVAPTVSLAAFLAISAFHFSGDLEGDVPLALRAAHGASPIVLPALLHGQELARLFGMLVPMAGAGALSSVLAAAAPIVLVALTLLLAVSVGRRLMGHPSSIPVAVATEAAAAAALTTLAPPLTAFAVYFCVLHSARHVLRTGRVFRLPARELLRAAALPTLATAAAAPVAFHLLEGGSFDVRTLQVVFIGLAALTVPHMLLIEPLRLRGWRA